MSLGGKYTCRWSMEEVPDDVTITLDRAVEQAILKDGKVQDRPRFLSDNWSCFNCRNVRSSWTLLKDIKRCKKKSEKNWESDESEWFLNMLVFTDNCLYHFWSFTSFFLWTVFYERIRFFFNILMLANMLYRFFIHNRLLMFQNEFIRVKSRTLLV